MSYPHQQWQSPTGYEPSPPPGYDPYTPGPHPGYSVGQSTGYPPTQGHPPHNPPQQGWPPAYPPNPPRKSSNGLVIGLIAGSVAIVLVALIVFVAPLVFFAKVSSETSDAIGNLDGSHTEQLLESDLEVTFGTFTRTDTSYSKSGKLPVTFRNKSSERASFYVQVEALDEQGDRIAEDTASVTSLSPGQSTTENLFTFVDNVDEIESATFRVASVSKH